MKGVLSAAALSAALASCTMLGQPAKYTLIRQPAGMALNSSGSVTVTRNADTVATSATVMGLAPNTSYVAHYHLQGSASANPCDSNGAPIMSSKMVGRSDAAGMLSLNGNVPSADVADATYYNIHTAKSDQGEPADPGVTCTPVQMR